MGTRFTISLSLTCCLFWISSAVAQPGPSPTPSVTLIPAPCIKDADLAKPRVDLRPCDTGADQVLRRTAPTGEKNGLLDTIEQHFSTRIQCFYDGYLPDFSHEGGSCGSGTPLLQGNTRINVCNLSDGETAENHLHRSCGTIRFGWEQSHANGLYVQALKYYRSKVTEEIQNTKALTVHTTCEPWARDYLTLMDEAKSLSDGIVQKSSPLAADAFKKGVNFCENDSTLMQRQLQQLRSPLSQEVVQTIPRTAACLMSGSRENRVALFATIAECEILDLADNFYIREIYKLNQEIGRVIKNCAEHAKHVGKKKGKSAAKKAGKKCYDRDAPTLIRGYYNKLPGRFESHLDHQWPLSSVPFLAGLAIGGKKRRKSARKPASGIRFILTGVLLALSLLLASCGDDSSTTYNPAGPPADVAIPPSDPHAASAAAGYISQTQSQHREAQRLVSGNDKSTAAEEGITQSAATAENSLITEKAEKSAPLPTMPKMELPKVGKTASRSAGGGNMSGSSLEMSGGDISTAPVLVAKLDPFAADPYGKGESTGGSPGGKGGKGRKGTEAPNFSFGSGGEAGSGPAPIEAKSFGGGAGKSDINPMSSSDPEDYFTRLDINDSLFKIVAKRYQHKAMSFVLPVTVKP